MKDAYLSLADSSEGIYREKGSKFLAFAYPVVSEEEVQMRLNELKKKYYDARHHCYAFVLKPPEGMEEIYRASDDGEPPHSAGDPILGQIRSHQLLDTLIVVVRYFGGTKLGVPGLINAYRSAAADAIAHNSVAQKYIEQTFTIEFTYPATSDVMKVINQYALTVLDQSFTEICQYRLSVRRRDYKKALAVLSQLQQVAVKH